MQEKQAIITLNYGYNENMWYKYMREVFIPSIRDYARRIQVDFILMNDNNSKYHNTWNQLQFMDYLAYYDRVMYIDGDCYIPLSFHYHFFNNVPYENIGAYIAIHKSSNCNVCFIVMVLNKNNIRYFVPPPPSIYEQKNKYTKNSNFICSLGKLMNNDCFLREECFVNEVLNKYNLKSRITPLINLYNNSPEYLVSKKLINSKNLFYHINLNCKLCRNVRNNTEKVLNNKKFYDIINKHFTLQKIQNKK